MQGEAGLVPGEAGEGFGEGQESRFFGIIACHGLAADPVADKIDHHEMRVTGAGWQSLERIDQSKDLYLYRGLLADFTQDRIFQPLAIVELAAGNRPVALERRTAAFDEQDIGTAKDYGTDGGGGADFIHDPPIMGFMTARYLLTASPEDIAEIFGTGPVAPFPPRYNIAPSQPVLIIRQVPEQRAARREAALALWGFIPAWSKDGRPGVGGPILNIRSETALLKNSFSGAMRRRRCLIPANGFYEWAGPKEDRQPFLVTWPTQASDEMPLFAIAGLWEHWLGEDGSELETVGILTRDGPTAAGRGRIPLTIPAAEYACWLHANEMEVARILPLLDWAVPSFRRRQVGKAVSDWRNEGPSLIAPLS